MGFFFCLFSLLNMVLMLLAPPTEWNPDTDHCISSMSGYPATKSIEAAGQAHFDLVVLRSQGKYHDHTEIKIEVTQKEEVKSSTSSDQASSNPIISLYGESDYYKLLNIGHLRWKATEKEIKKAYRKMILNHHPDKQAQAQDEVDDEVFKSISAAYDCLSNPEKRRAYDSKDPFDDTVPSEHEARSEEFFELFSSVFERNSKWSILNDVPKLGNMDDDIESVFNFYEFWRNFKSWREFSAGEEEFDLEEAECREEKRWMERENKKLTKKMKKEENGRLIYLVNLSYKYDPRIINWKEEQEKEKLRKKAERKAAKIRRREEANREAEKEQERKEAEAKQRTIENKQIRKKRPQLRKICRLAREEHDSDPINNPFNPLEEHVEILCKEMNLKQFNVLIKSLQNENGPSSFRNMIIEYNVITPDDSYGLNSLEEDKEADEEPIPNQTVMVEQ